MSTEVTGGRGRGLAHAVVEDLRGQMLDGQLAPGARLPSEAQLIATYDVSRTVVREAVSRLQAAGLVETFQGRGSFVLAQSAPTPFVVEATQVRTVHDAVAMMELRIGVESEAAGLAAGRASPAAFAELEAALSAFAEGDTRGAVEADYRFHLAVSRASGNRFYVQVLESLGPMMILLPRFQLDEAYSMDDDAHFHRVTQEHANVVDAIRMREPEAARAAMRVHLTSSRHRLAHG